MEPITFKPTTVQDHLVANRATEVAARKATNFYRPMVSKLQDEVDALIGASRAQRTAGRKSFADRLGANAEVARLLKNRAGRMTVTLSLEQKTTLTSAAVGSETSGVLAIDHVTPVVDEARQELRIRDLFVARPTTMQLVDFIRVLTTLAPAGMVPETTLKPENATSFTVESERVRTIATFLPASEQVISDSTELASYLSTALPYEVNLTEETQLLYGDATGENLHGLIPQAQAASYVAPSSPATPATKMDQIGAAIEQLALAKEVPPTFVVMNTADWWSIALAKDSNGRYILNNSQNTLFKLTVVPTTSIAAGTYLVGSGLPAAAEICDREEVVVDISTEHEDYFVRNLVGIRAEKRVALLVKRPNAFITGTFQ